MRTAHIAFLVSGWLCSQDALAQGSLPSPALGPATSVQVGNVATNVAGVIANRVPGGNVGAPGGAAVLDQAGLLPPEAVPHVAGIAALRARSDATLTDGAQIRALGYYAPGDPGAGTFRWVASSTSTDDGGMGGPAPICPGTTTTDVLDVNIGFTTLTDLSISTTNPSTVKQTAGAYIKVAPGATHFRAERITCTEFFDCIDMTGTTPSIDINRLRAFLYLTGLAQSDAAVRIRGGLDVRIDDFTAQGEGHALSDDRRR